MPLPLNITELLHGKAVEWERLEFKRGWNPVDVLHTLCAFANDLHNLGGGYLILGVEEADGRPVLPPVGLKAQELDKMQKEILRLTQNSMQPAYHPLVFPEVLDGRNVLIIWAYGGELRPYKAKVELGKGAKEWAYYLRKQSTTVRAKGQDEVELLSLANRIPHDDRIHRGARLEDLSKPLIKEFLQTVGSGLAAQVDLMTREELGRALHIVGGPPASLPEEHRADVL